MYYCYLDTPIGELLLAGSEDALHAIGFPQGKMRRDPEPDWIFKEQPFAEVSRQLLEYFAGERKTFDVPLDLSGTEFQLSVLEELQRIAYGDTASYGDIAKRIGRPKAVRAVGAANGRNPIPDHRPVSPRDWQPRRPHRFRRRSRHQGSVVAARGRAHAVSVEQSRQIFVARGFTASFPAAP